MNNLSKDELRFPELEGIAKKIYKNEKGYMEAEFKYGIKMIYIPKGEFTRGDSVEENRPQDDVYLDGYWIGKYPVTGGQFYAKVNLGMEKNVFFENFSLKCPIMYINWHACVTYCDSLSKELGLKFRLPTEAEWEKAARGTSLRKYPWGNEEPDNTRANYGLYNTNVIPVGQYTIGMSPYGCLDMAGNVKEWCFDWYDGNYYEYSPFKNPKGPLKGTTRVQKGGGWDWNEEELQCSYRRGSHPEAYCDSFGFRLALKL